VWRRGAAGGRGGGRQGVEVGVGVEVAVGVATGLHGKGYAPANPGTAARSAQSTLNSVTQSTERRCHEVAHGHLSPPRLSTKIARRPLKNAQRQPSTKRSL
jgi:hypothetical protein